MGVVAAVLPAFTGVYDTERFLRDAEILYKAKLNAAIAEINAEKNDFTIPAIKAEAWYFGHLPKIWSHKQFIVWTLAGIDPTDRAKGSTLRTVKIEFEVCQPDSGEKEAEQVTWKLLRYTRALEKVANENFAELRSTASLVVDNLTPQKLSFDGKMLRTAGVRIQASLSSN